MQFTNFEVYRKPALDSLIKGIRRIGIVHLYSRAAEEASRQGHIDLREVRREIRRRIMAGERPAI